ncbi:MAG: glycosyltransferase, partial [Candidatus Saccharimonadales bacterium]
YIVIDGGSTDGSVEVVARYAALLSHWTSERDGGQSDAINKGFRLATGDIVAWLNSDDLLTPQALHKVAVRFAREARPAVVCGTAELRSQNLSTVMWTFESPPTTTAEILSYPEGRQIGQPSVFMSRELLDFPEPLRRDLNYIMDLDLWLRLSKKCEFTVLTESLSWIRYHLDAKTYQQPYSVFQELEPYIAGHKNLLSPAQMEKLLKACRRECARGYLVSAFFKTKAHRRLLALALVWKAFIHYPEILSYRTLYAVIARACLPANLQRLLFRS